MYALRPCYGNNESETLGNVVSRGFTFDKLKLCTVAGTIA